MALWTQSTGSLKLYEFCFLTDRISNANGILKLTRCLMIKLYESSRVCPSKWGCFEPQALWRNRMPFFWTISLMRVVHYQTHASGSHVFSLACSPKSQVRVWDCPSLFQVTIFRESELKMSKIIAVISSSGLSPKSLTSILRPLWNPRGHPQLSSNVRF